MINYAIVGFISAIGLALVIIIDRIRQRSKKQKKLDAINKDLKNEQQDIDNWAGR